MSEKPLSAKELLKHPAFSSNDWNLQPAKSGHATVASSRRGGPFPLWYEIHGAGPTKIVWIMGLGSPAEHWKRQTQYFGHENKNRYSSLVFDNRGIGKTASPTCLYKTTEMAQDVVDLLQILKWIDLAEPIKNLHVVGISLGGMIAQELALLIPGHISSLSVVSSSPRLARTAPSLDSWKKHITMLVPVGIDGELQRLSERLFSEEWLKKPDTENADPAQNFPLNQDRFAADELLSRQNTQVSFKGFMLQAIGAAMHYKSESQLAEIATSIGHSRIMVVHGEIDQFIPFHHFEFFKSGFGLEGIEYLVFPGCGHLPLWENEAEFNSALERLIHTTTGLTTRLWILDPDIHYEDLIGNVRMYQFNTLRHGYKSFYPGITTLVTGYQCANQEYDPLFLPPRRADVGALLEQTHQPDSLALYGGTRHDFGTRTNVTVSEQRFGKEEAFVQAVKFFRSWA
ncbi:Alpha/Beta hydrolase protein [Dactylonectria estremocensis]|uniref:Alpha/Beta hydrolase protein n=1 Tax=Dactylonectria estremocensis TaxID=1079267 RepID=A0A9P9IFT1_9HYPO|nr:Alpha/Beta hydrolase protein [Dactylonectria estremocensis]